MQLLTDNLGSIVSALVVSSVVTVGSSVVGQSVHQALLERNIQATEKLTQAVSELQISMAIFGERYVTRKEMKEELKEAKNGS
ncbi:ORF.11 [Pseudomonas phage PaP3]|uniref:Uncharacterized protein n=5 Tax=Bruynoghevirus TaxID=545932 RepID=A0A6G9LHF3_9CAUD|nr:ORF.11 [Pseudomonas phage PaP3]YP_007183218.1 hypothetical protein BN425_orf_10 [Pseudomonas phage vB_PaeP_p2-10_Or1]YP_009210846.1 hypothetical protein AVV32_gp63 [Pseudomonas phage PhiCHU]ATW62326.1 hypothetical protein Delta_p11 [Pseudomonas phage Delta]QIQ64419.1 hypothetical protein Epa1_p11 [Pseudomonas phage Epa1]QIQ66490.1 hypothetical protein clash_58 [Pseudomonas phage clash]QIQ67461.1 hypothetical protein otherone_58 [Pseudomonas phage otherone]QSH71728.1 hypothetical protein [